MLQIVSGKFYTDEARRSNLLRGVLYSNMRAPWRCDAIETAAGTLKPSTGFDGLRTFTYEIIEEYEGSPGSGVLVSIGVDHFLQEFAAVASFGLNLICTPDPDLLRRLVGDQPMSPNTTAPPRKFIGRAFNDQVVIHEEQLDEFKTFVRDLLALKRSQYQAAMGAIRSYVTGLHRVGDDLDLAYTLLVASIESLAQAHRGPPPVWEDYEERKRLKLDTALAGAPGTVANRVRSALLDVEHVALSRRFRAFALDHVGRSFFREEAADEMRPVGAADLTEAVAEAYNIRSRYIHTLAPVPRQISHVWDLGDTVRHEGRPVLTLHGLARLARHLILGFVKRGAKVEREHYNYRLDFPNVVTHEMAPQYWVWQHEQFASPGARRKLTGFMELLIAVHRREHGAELVDIRDLLRKYERLIPRAKAEHRIAMVALYVLFHAVVREEDRLAGHERIIGKHQRLLDGPSLEGLAVRFGLLRGLEWEADEIAELYAAYYRQKYRKGGLALPPLLETAFALALAEALRTSGKSQQALEVLEGARDNQPKAPGLDAAIDRLTADADTEISWVDLLIPPAETAAEPPGPDRKGTL